MGFESLWSVEQIFLTLTFFFNKMTKIVNSNNVATLRQQIAQTVLPVAVGENPGDTFLVPASTILSQTDFPIEENLKKLLSGNTGKKLMGVEAPATLPQGNLLQALKMLTFNVAAAIMAADPAALQFDREGLTDDEVWELQTMAAADWIKDEAPAAEAAEKAAETTEEAAPEITGEQPLVETEVTSLEEQVAENPAVEAGAETVQATLKEMGVEVASPGAALIIADAMVRQRDVNNASVALTQAAEKTVEKAEELFSELKKQLRAVQLINNEAAETVTEILAKHNLALPSNTESSNTEVAAAEETAA